MRRNGGVLVSVVVSAGLLAGPAPNFGAPAGGATPSVPRAWTVTPSPSPFEPTFVPLTAVSCSSATSCFAVGIKRPLVENTFPGDRIERWDGTTWSVVPSPNPSDTSLNAVSCVSAVSCVAVGNSSDATLIEQWDGTAWSVVPSPNPSDANFVALKGVSCSAAADCFAVGGYATTAGASGSLVEHWDGTSWALVTSPSGPSSGTLFAVSCSTSTSCVAVGASTTGTLVEQWDGATWSIVPSPTPPEAPTGDHVQRADTTLDGVSCTSPTSCVAVGFTDSASLIERWDGASWSIVHSPDPPGPDSDQIIELSAVSCASATDCQAVGEVFQIYVMNDVLDRAPTQSIAEHWNGSTWSIVPRPPGIPTTVEGVPPLGELNGVSCPTITSCAAVGNSAMAERWDGSSWSFAPFDPNTSFSYLNNVSCRSATSCIAVGTAYAFSQMHTLVEQWDGATWSVVPTPDPRGVQVDAELNAVSCASPTNCTAVGDFSRRTSFSTTASTQLIEHWDGTRWSISANTSSTLANTGRLDGISCPSPTSCNAVGSYGVVVDGYLVNKVLAEHWDGKRWTIAPTPKRAGGGLSAVSCWGITTCFAVGQTKAGTATTERWNGKSWSIVPTPNPKGGGVGLSGISCPSPVSCTAVGTGLSGADYLDAVIERWNGKRWSIVPAPRPAGAAAVALVRVSCHSTNSCTAVGRSDDVAGYDNFPYDGARLVVEHWNGTGWSIVRPETPSGATGAVLSGVACPTDRDCAGAGSYLLDSDGYWSLNTLAAQGG